MGINRYQYTVVDTNGYDGYCDWFVYIIYTYIYIMYLYIMDIDRYQEILTDIAKYTSVCIHIRTYIWIYISRFRY